MSKHNNAKHGIRGNEKSIKSLKEKRDSPSIGIKPFALQDSNENVPCKI